MTAISAATTDMTEFLCTAGGSNNGGGGRGHSWPPSNNCSSASPSSGGFASTAANSSGGGGAFFSALVDISLDQLPIRKRYLKSHGGDVYSGGSSADSRGRDDYLPAGGGSSSDTNFSPSCQGTEMSGSRELEARLRAGVIRHSSDPKRCLAYYYMNNKSTS